MNTGIDSKLNGYAHLVAVLRSLEDDIGLGELTPLERNIIAALSLDDFENGAKSDDILNHRLLDRPTTSSFYRALKRLRLRKIVEVAGNRKTGRYRLSHLNYLLGTAQRNRLLVG